MKLEPVTSENASLYGDELDQMFRLRHRIFVERMGWEALRKPDGIERDQFDNGDATYLLLTHDRTVIGCHRLLPTLKPHLFSEVFPHLCDVKGVLRSATACELNRTCVDLERLPSNICLHARKAVMLGLMEYCLLAGIEKLSVLTAPHYISHYLGAGWKILPLGVPVEMDGETQVAVEIHCTQDGLDSMRECYGLHDPLVRPAGIKALATPTHWPVHAPHRAAGMVLQ